MAQPETAGSKEWEDLKKFVSYVKTFSGVVTALVTALPLSGVALSSVTPPWPPASYVFAAVVSLLTILVLFFVFRESEEASLPDKRIAVILGIFALLGFVCYLSMMAKLVVTVGEDRHLTGFGFTDEAQQEIDKKSVAKDPKDLLAYFGYQSEDRIWKYRTLARLLLFFSFCGSFILLAACFGQFMIRNYVRDNRQTGPGGSHGSGPPPGPPRPASGTTGQGNQSFPTQA